MKRLLVLLAMTVAVPSVALAGSAAKKGTKTETKRVEPKKEEKRVEPKGKTYKQLERAAEGKRDQVFDGRRDQGVVDTRGVRPWAPGERERELAKPRVQTPTKKRTAPPPSPKR